MRKVVALGSLLVSLTAVGCARPNELGWSPGYTLADRSNMIARNWDMEGKMIVDDIDHLLLLRPMSGLTDWHVR